MRVNPDDRKKKHHVKSRHGCISCKKRHLKCDEHRPACQRCLSDFGKCEGYRTPKTWLFEPANDDASPTVLEFDSSSPTSNGTLNSSFNDSSPPSSHTPSSGRFGSQASTSPEPEHTRQKRWAPKSRSGCTTCKKRRIKCDEARPRCSRCVASNRDCEYITALKEEPNDDTAIVEILQRKMDMFEDPDHPPAFKYINSTPYRSQTEYQTFVHWQSRTESCMIISRSFGSFNIFGDMLPKAAWSYDCLKHGLLSAASVTASIEKFALGEFNERQAVLEAVKQSSLAITSMFREKPPPEVTVLVAFVFWFMEAWIGSWDRAVMHLASAARMCQQGSAKPRISEAVVWYVNACNDGVPQALRTPEILSLVQNIEHGLDEKFHIRLLWGIREAVAGIATLQRARVKGYQLRPQDYAQFDAILASHQAQMRYMIQRWRLYARLQLTKLKSQQDIPRPSEVPMYSMVMEQITLFLSKDARFDALMLGVRLKMIQRSLPLFIAGTNAEIRRDAALSIPIRVEIPALNIPELELEDEAYASG